MPNRWALLRAPWVPLFLLTLVGVVLLTSTTTRFLTPANGYVIFANAALLAVIGFSQLVVLSVGQMNLAVAGIGNFTGVVAGLLMVEAGVPSLLAGAAAIVVGALCGLLNGMLITRVGVNGFIATLATGGIFTGLALGITQTSPYTGLPADFTTFGTGRWGFLPFLSVATIAVSIALYFYFRSTPSGRSLLAVGGNPEAAELSGLPVHRAVLKAHVLSGAISAIAGVMAAAQLHEANPLAATNWLIESFTIAIVGGALLSGGVISVAGVIIASLVLAIINDALILLNVDPYWVGLIQGALIFVAVLIGRPSVWPALVNSVRNLGGSKKEVL